MGKLSAAEALQDNLKAVNVRFMGDNGAPSPKVYTYKVTFNCNPGDYILVPVSVGCNLEKGEVSFQRLAVCVVESVGGLELLVNSGSNFHNWAIGPIRQTAISMWQAITIRDNVVQAEYDKAKQAEELSKLRNQVYNEIPHADAKALHILANSKVVVA